MRLMDYPTGTHLFPLASTVVVLLLALCALKLSVDRLSKKSKKLNYPPVVGTIFNQFLNLKRIQDYQADLSHKYKTFRSLAPSCNYVFTVDPANVEYILKANFENYCKGTYFRDIMHDLLGDGIFVADGEKWRHQRKVASYEFSTRVLRDYSSLVFRSKAAELAERVFVAASSNQMFDIQDLFKKSTMDSIFKVGFGVELDTFSGSQEGNAFMDAFDDSSSQMLQRFFDVSWKIKRFLNIGSEATAKKNINLIDDYVYKLIDVKVKQQEQHKGSMDKEDILSRFLVEREKDPERMSYKFLRDIVLSFVIAGRDTTSGTLSWFFYMLCKHPDVQDKVAKEVRKATGEIEGISIGEFVAKLNEEALNVMQYLHAALTETLRLYPAVPLDPKICCSDDTLPDGFDVKKGDLVIYQPYSMGRMRFLWGEDAENFRPERWLDEDGVFQPESPFKFTAFQAGPRICLGKEFAYRQMKIFSAILLQFFRFKLWDEEKCVNYRAMLTLQINEGLYLSAMQR